MLFLWQSPLIRSWFPSREIVFLRIYARIHHNLGCYWGTEKFVVKDFQKKFPNSIQDAKVGFMSPDPNAMVNPTYRQVNIKCVALRLFI